MYNVGRLTDAPGGGRFLSRGDTLAVGFPFLGDTLAYWWHQAEPIFLFRRTEGGLHSRPVPGSCYIADANLLLPVVASLA